MCRAIIAVKSTEAEQCGHFRETLRIDALILGSIRCHGVCHLCSPCITLAFDVWGIPPATPIWASRVTIELGVLSITINLFINLLNTILVPLLKMKTRDN